jgi:hypothetical protein
MEGVMENILMVGEDSVLLLRRAAILQKLGASIACCNSSQLDAHRWNENVDLVVLCHTIKPGVHRSIVIAEVYRRWPKARVLQILTDPVGPESASDRVAGDLGEQGELLELSMEFLRKRPESEWYPDVDRFSSQRAS